MMTDCFLPAMRELVARKLTKDGWSQGSVAKSLGVTQAAVSLYLRSGGRAHALLGRLGVTEEQGALYASLLAEDLKKSPVYAVSTLYSLWSDALGRGSLCSAHRFQYPALANCDMCVVRFGLPESGVDALERVAAAVKVVEGSSVFVRLMPEVSVNIAYAPEGATSVAQVVAVPGRIVKVNGLPRSFMRPEYGASTHVASVLLSMLSRNPSRRAAMNVRYDAGVEAAVREIGLSVVRAPGGPSLLEGLAGSLRVFEGPVDALVDPGGEGTEPGLYLFAEDPVTVARLALRLARAYVASR